LLIEWSDLQKHDTGKTNYGNELLLSPSESETNVYSIGPSKVFCELITRPSTRENCWAVNVQDNLSV